MQPGNKRLEEATAWLRVAADDLRLAEAALGLDPPITGLALYHALQAAEKALKGYLVFRGHTFPFTHNLTELARPLGHSRRLTQRYSRSSIQDSISRISRRFTATRGEPLLPTIDEARPWVDAARAIWTAVEDRLKDQSTESAPDEGEDPGAEKSREGADGGKGEA
jgi:HEPN domain-containing protein